MGREGSGAERAVGAGRWWKLLGLAGVLGVAASGALAARSERRRRSYGPEEIRERLHARYARVSASRDAGAVQQPTGGADPR